MGFRSNAYATVFSVAKGNGNFHEVNLATSKKGKDGNYATDFRGFARFIGNASTKIAQYSGENSKENGNHPVTRIKLGEVEVTNNYNAETKTTYVNYLVYSFEFADEAGNNGNKSGKSNRSGENSAPKSANDYANSFPEDEESLFT